MYGIPDSQQKSPPLGTVGSTLRKTASCHMLHSDLFPEFPCDRELIRVEALSTRRICLLWCSGCGTEFTYMPECEWVPVVYPGMKSDLEM